MFIIIQLSQVNGENYKNTTLQELLKYMSIKKGNDNFTSFDYIIQVRNFMIIKFINWKDYLNKAS